MKKYGKILMVAVVTFFASISVVFAKEVTISELLSEVEQINPTAKDVYVVGDYAFTSAHPLTSQDVMLAARSIKVTDTTGKTNQNDIYKEMVMQHFNRNKTSKGYSAWNIANPKIGTADKKVSDLNQKVSVHFIDYNLVNDVTADVEEQLEKDALELDSENKTEDYGFNSITYENNTLTFDIQDINRNLVDYAQSSIIEMFNTIVSGKYGFVSIQYTGVDGPTTKTKAELAEENTKTLAADVLLALATKNSEANTLTYLDVANKETTATVTYEDEYGTHEVTYTLKFTYDVEKEKDIDLTKAAESLKTALAEKGFKNVTYSKENNTAIFEISEIEKLLKDCKEAVLPLFEKYVVGATKIIYRVDGENPVEIESVDPKQGVTYAAQLLALMAGDKVTSAKELTLGAVAGKTATADVTYTIGDEVKTITYTLKFTYDVEKEKDEDLTKAAESLKITLAEKGFKNVSYSKENNTATFEIGEIGKLLKDCKEAVLPLFEKYVVGATKIVYHVGEKTETIDEIDSTKGSTYAAQLLALMAGEEVTDAKQLTLGAVAGKTATADVTYTIGGKEETITYTLKFAYDVEKEKDADLTKAADELTKKLATKGFKNVSYSEKDKAATFEISDENQLLKDCKDDVLPLFEKYVVGATKVVYHVEGQEDVTIDNVDSSKGATYAAQLLALMAGDEIKDTSQLTLGAVAGKTATADVTYTIGGKEQTITYTLKFVSTTLQAASASSPRVFNAQSK